jgi:hypothetical protein
MLKIRFIYQGDDYNQDREIVSSAICQLLSEELELPETIEIVFATMNESVYGNTLVNPRFKNRININNTLTFNEIPHVLVHELIHLNQITIGRLSSTTNGRFKWDNREYNLDNYPNYDELPWEKDVVNRQQDLLIKLAEKFNTSR